MLIRIQERLIVVLPVYIYKMAGKTVKERQRHDLAVYAREALSVFVEFTCYHKIGAVIFMYDVIFFTHCGGVLSVFGDGSDDCALRS